MRRDVVAADFEEAGDADVVRKVADDLEERPDTDLDKLLEALQVVRMARVTLQGIDVGSC